jgi:glycosyltransferase domain-containing protein
MMVMKCTVVIPTYNRPACLKRILSYYSQYGSGLPILVADSSSKENKKLNRETVSSFQDAFFTYLDKYDPSTNPFHKFLDALRQVSTEYCLFCADDDFVTPDGIYQSMDFLEHNPDYTVAHGSYILFRLEGNESDKRYFWLNLYCSPELNASFKSASTLNCDTLEQSIIFPSAIERFRYHMANFFPTFYAVHRTDLLKQVLEETLKNTCECHFGELLPSMLTLIHGKMKYLDVLYGVRDASTARSVDLQLLTDNSPAERIEEYAKFKVCLGIHLSAESGLDKEASEKLINDYMASRQIYWFESRLMCRIVSLLQYMPGWIYRCIRTLYRKIMISGHNSDTSVFVDSPPPYKYRNDFAQIRQIVLAHDCESKPL